MERSNDHDPSARERLARLNASEREVLRLLAQGHTAKSIAAAKGWSVGAVNERLREARRKTGAGSSRELARMLRAQENRDEEIGVAPREGVPAEGGDGPARPRVGRWRRRELGMVALVGLGGAAALALLLQTSQAPDDGAGQVPLADYERAREPAGDPMLRGMMPPAGFEPVQLHARLRAEEQDARWASATEAALRDVYEQDPDIESGVEQLRIICAATLCEVAGYFARDLSHAERAAATRALQGPEINDGERELGLKSLVRGFGSTQDERNRDGFVVYLSRIEQADPAP